MLHPLHTLIGAHVLAAERLHGDDTKVPILTKGKTVSGHIWTYVRDDRPFGSRAPPAAVYSASRDRRHEHPVRHLRGFAGILQADGYDGYNELYQPFRLPGPITSALCWAHARRQFFEVADIATNARRGKNAAAISPIALEEAWLRDERAGSSPTRMPLSASSERSCFERDDEWAIQPAQYIALETIVPLNDDSTVRLPTISSG